MRTGGPEAEAVDPRVAPKPRRTPNSRLNWHAQHDYAPLRCRPVTTASIRAQLGGGPAVGKENPRFEFTDVGCYPAFALHSVDDGVVAPRPLPSRNHVQVIQEGDERQSGAVPMLHGTRRHVGLAHTDRAPGNPPAHSLGLGSRHEPAASHPQSVAGLKLSI